MMECVLSDMNPQGGCTFWSLTVRPGWRAPLLAVLYHCISSVTYFLYDYSRLDLFLRGWPLAFEFNVVLTGTS